MAGLIHVACCDAKTPESRCFLPLHKPVGLRPRLSKRNLEIGDQ
jgi:hypothetical protein